MTFSLTFFFSIFRFCACHRVMETGIVALCIHVMVDWSGDIPVANLIRDPSTRWWRGGRNETLASREGQWGVRTAQAQERQREGTGGWESQGNPWDLPHTAALHEGKRVNHVSEDDVSYSSGCTDSDSGYQCHTRHKRSYLYFYKIVTDTMYSVEIVSGKWERQKQSRMKITTAKLFREQSLKHTGKSM